MASNGQARVTQGRRMGRERGSDDESRCRRDDAPLVRLEDAAAHPRRQSEIVGVDNQDRPMIGDTTGDGCRVLAQAESLPRRSSNQSNRRGLRSECPSGGRPGPAGPHVESALPTPRTGVAATVDPVMGPEHGVEAK